MSVDNTILKAKPKIKPEKKATHTVYEFSRYCGDKSSECLTCELLSASAFAAELKLAEIVKENMMVNQLRLFLKQDLGHVSFFSDAEVFKQAVRRLSSWQLHLLKKEVPIKGRAGLQGPKIERENRQPTSVNVGGTSSMRFDAPIQKSDIGEVSPQVAVLVSASENGAPFCEICEKKKREAEQGRS